jgi:hypothetical protein
MGPSRHRRIEIAESLPLIAVRAIVEDEYEVLFMVRDIVTGRSGAVR